MCQPGTRVISTTCKYHKYMCEYALVSMSVRASVHRYPVCQPDTRVVSTCVSMR